MMFCGGIETATRTVVNSYRRTEESAVQQIAVTKCRYAENKLGRIDHIHNLNRFKTSQSNSP